MGQGCGTTAAACGRATASPFHAPLMDLASGRLRCDVTTFIRSAASVLDHYHPLSTATVTNPPPTAAPAKLPSAATGGADAALFDGAVAEEEESIPVTDRSYWTQKIHLLCSKREAGGIDEALRLLDRLRLRGYLPDSLNLSSVIHGLCATGRFLEGHRRLLLSVSSGLVPDDRTSNVLVARLLDARSPDATRRVIDHLVASKPAFVLSASSYNRLIDQFCSQSRLADARSVFLDMKTRGLSPDVVSYTALLGGFGRAGELVVARQLFDEMIASGVAPNSLTYSALIRGVVRKRRIEEGREMMGELWTRMACEEDPCINNAAFSNLVDALCREGFFREVFWLAEEMPQGKCVREDFAYGQMMDSLCRVGRHHGASRIVYIMKKRGFTPSVVSYNCIIHGLSKEGEGGCMRAYQLFREGVEFGYSPSESTYKSLIEGLCWERDVYKAKDVTEFMLGKKGANKTRIYNMFLNALCLAGDPSEQLNVLVSMFQNQCHPDVVTLNTVIHGFCKIGKIDEALKILGDMLQENFCAPDMVTFTTVLHGLLDAGRKEEALEILHYKMPACSCNPSTVTYNAILHGLCKLQSMDEAMVIFDEMAHQAVSADSMTHAIIMEGLLEMGQVNQAKRFWEDVIWPSDIHDDFVYAAVLKGLSKLGKLNEACDFLYELVDCGVAPGIVNYNILIDGACKLGSKREAYQVVSEMRKNGLIPDAVTWRILEKLHKNKTKQCMPYLQVSKSERDLQDEEVIPRSPNNRAAESPEKECEEKIEMKAALDGIVDMNFSMELNDEKINSHDDDDIRRKNFSGDVYKEGSLQSEWREPLSRVARRVFGLL